MTAARSSSESPDQAAISCSVRKQPRHSPLSPSTTQTFTQGVGMERGAGNAATPAKKVKTK